LDLIDGLDVGAMEATGIEVLGPDGKDKATGRIARIAYASEGQGSRPSEARVEGMDFEGEDARVRIGAIPFSGFSFRSTGEGLRGLGDLGDRAVDVSSVVAASWNEAGNELLLREVSFRGAEMGTLTLRGTLGNLTKDVFSPDTTVALVSLVGATAKTLDFT